MADDKNPSDTHSEVEVASHVRTARDKVFFPGKALVDERTKAELDEAVQVEEDRKASAERAMETGEFEEREDELGDTRTSTTKASRAAAKRGGSKRGK